MYATGTTTVGTMKTRQTVRFVRKGSSVVHCPTSASPPPSGAMVSGTVQTEKMRRQAVAHPVPMGDIDATETSAAFHIGQNATCVGIAMEMTTKRTVLHIRCSLVTEERPFQ